MTSLDQIRDQIDELARGNVIDIGDLLRQAKAQCKNGEWIRWLNREFRWSVDSAERYMRVAALAARFRILRNLKVTAGTLYELAVLAEDEEHDLPAVVEALAKHATQTRLRARCEPRD
jgi:hypothetical protein